MSNEVVGAGGEVLTLEEAALRYNFDIDRLRRRLVAGGVPGAYQTTTAAGEEWRIPSASLVALGYRPVASPDQRGGTPNGVPPPAPPAAAFGPDEGNAEATLAGTPPVGDAPATGTGPGDPVATEAFAEGDSRRRASDREVMRRDQRAIDVAYQLMESEFERIDAEQARLDAEWMRLDNERARLAAEWAALEQERAELAAEGRAEPSAPADAHVEAQLAFILEEVQALREAFTALGAPRDPAAVEAARAARAARRAARAARSGGSEEWLEPPDDAPAP